ncbi:hypothetical protein BDC45DRAFT_508111 [Circinella umbellata]|nr:hypothetical protein BDC45DRAFT_508111 [Circinella umbellata]
MSEEHVHKTLNILETYFSDANLNFDKLLKKYISEDTHGFVSIDKLLKLKRFKDNKVTQEDIIKATEGSSRLYLNDSKTSVGRIKPFVAFKKEELDDWSIYVEGLKKPYHTQEKISALFSKLIGPVTFIRFPLDQKKQPNFYGFCFIEFAEKEHVLKAIEKMDCSKGQEHEESEIMKLALKVISKKDYNELEKQYLQIQSNAKAGIKRAWDEYYEEQERKELEAMKIEEEQEQEEDTIYPKGVIAFITNLAPKSSKSVISTLLQQADVQVAYVDYKKNAPSCHVRLNSSEDTDKLVNYFKQNKTIQTEGKDEVGKAAVSEGQLSQALGVQKITGEQEKIFWKDENHLAMLNKIEGK